MSTTVSQEQHLTTLSQVRRVRGQPVDLYDIIFLDQQDHIIVPLTEWYRLRKEQGPTSTRNTYLSCLLPFFTDIVSISKGRGGKKGGKKCLKSLQVVK